VSAVAALQDRRGGTKLRPDLLRLADTKPEDTQDGPWQLGGMVMGPGTFNDGAIFEPNPMTANF
jgi:hypothetical protein